MAVNKNVDAGLRCIYVALQEKRASGRTGSKYALLKGAKNNGENLKLPGARRRLMPLPVQCMSLLGLRVPFCLENFRLPFAFAHTFAVSPIYTYLTAMSRRTDGPTAGKINDVSVWETTHLWVREVWEIKENRNRSLAFRQEVDGYKWNNVPAERTSFVHFVAAYNILLQQGNLNTAKHYEDPGWPQLLVRKAKWETSEREAVLNQVAFRFTAIGALKPNT